MEREKIRTSMIWCLDHAESAEEVCVCECMCVCMSVWVCMCVCVYEYVCVIKNN